MDTRKHNLIIYTYTYTWDYKLFINRWGWAKKRTKNGIKHKFNIY